MSANCDDCGLDYPESWDADNRLWNEIMHPNHDRDREAAGMVCLTCFIWRADSYFADTEWRIAGWHLAPTLHRR